jgi:ATP-dependent Clp protease ATP-binding subunit ClpA
VEEFQRAHPVTLNLFGRLLAEGKLREQGSDKIADFSQAILIFTSASNAVEVERIQQEMTDYDEIGRAVEKHSAQSEFFRPLFEAGIDRVFPFRKLDSRAFAEIGLVQFLKVANELGLSVEFITYESLIDHLARKYQFQKTGVHEWIRTIFDRYYDDLIAAKERGTRSVQLRAGEDGELSVPS